MSDLKKDQDFLKSIGKCGSTDGKGHICTVSANHYPREHQAQVLGGVDDGKILAQWAW